MYELKFTEKLCVMTMKNDIKIKEELTCRFKIDMRNVTNFDPSTRKSKKFVFYLAPCDQSIYCLSDKSTEELSFMTLKCYANFEEKLACGLKKDFRDLGNFHQSTWKRQNWDFDGILLSKVEKVWPENLQRSYASEEWCKIWRGIDWSFQNWHEKFNKFWLEHSKF